MSHENAGAKHSYIGRSDRLHSNVTSGECYSWVVKVIIVSFARSWMGTSLKGAAFWRLRQLAVCKRRHFPATTVRMCAREGGWKRTCESLRALSQDYCSDSNA